MTRGEILLFGDINIDTVWPVNEFPTPGRDAYAKSVSVGVGGAVFNSAVVLDKLGERTALLACLGEDIWAEKVTETLQQTSINQAYLRKKAEITTGLIFLIVTPDGERTMYSCRGANAQFEASDVDEGIFRDATLLHISGYALLESPQKEAAWRAVEFARKHQVPICLDTGLDPALLNPEDLRRILPELAICVTGLKETNALFGLSEPKEAADYLLSLGVQLVAIKLGEKGCFAADRQHSYFCPGFSVKAVDTTGAGDSFTAGLIYGWVKGMSLQASAILGSALGALATTVYGVGLSLPGKQEVLDFLKSAPIDSASKQNGIEEVISFLEKVNQ
jgi:ribokinase